MAKPRVDVQAKIKDAEDVFLRSRLGGKRAFRVIVEEAMTEAAKFWTERYLPLHFKSNAPLRYDFPHSTASWRKYKENAARIRLYGPFDYLRRAGVDSPIPSRRGQYTGLMPNPFRGQPALPMKYSGLTFKDVMAQRSSGEMIGGARLIKSRKHGFVIRMPIRVPHAVRTEYGGWLVKLHPDEHNQLARVMFDHINKAMGV